MAARCALCGRRLTRPSPDGYGPRCRAKLRTAAGRTAGQQDVRPQPGPGQTAIRIDPYQPALPLLPRPPYPADRVWRGRTIHTIPAGDRL